ncbi:hypothetical protein Rhein_3705 [Rheinheimera sp. A13L]|uniref:hypothetical protein n=1 Tax=Rheinheimera sp. A13L TaxID=506534 RepID=UPI0002124C96|nr:hypothetical protein [Rheinheimera sp. A13L]EGM76295.1 hypothetical protein Rhein_3705 [Rheinheimera sp. A13L]
MIPERLYETLPYLYVLCGAQSVLWLPHWTAALSGVVLIFVGAVVWVIRSEKRRSPYGIKFKEHGVLPFWCYELQPFIYLTSGALLFNYAPSSLLYPSAMILLVLGLQLWLCRICWRSHSK